MLLNGPPGAIIIELSPLVQTHDLNMFQTQRAFPDWALALYSRISKIATGCICIDVITD